MTEGAGVHLRRAFGYGQERLFDPFLMLDDFRSDHPSQYQAGFPWHPHRGIATITYMLEGEVDHGDSMGNSGTIGAGDVQWMTARSGVVHQEMPRGDARGRMGGFQLWANLPAGPAREVMIEPEYLDVTLGPAATWTHPTRLGDTVFAYLFEGSVRFGEAGDDIAADHGTVVLLEDGDLLTMEAGSAGARFLLVSGKPLNEPIAWRGPIVMNTQAELDTAWRELSEGTFVKPATGG